MDSQLGIEKCLELSKKVPIIDVRSPKEFEHAHIPGALNLPLFSNEERAKVGICYKNKGREASIILGLELVGPKLAEFAKAAKQLEINGQLLVHCWRGGMRSSSMAWLFNTVGIQTYTLAGGYKAYRRFIKSQFSKKVNLIVLGGMTGSGKTEILSEISNYGNQVIDLEKIANHKGSAFGAFGQRGQPSTEQFENNLFETWKHLDLNKPVWIEDESKTIGKIWLPDELFSQMRSSKVISIELPVEERIDFLVKEYGTFPDVELKKSVLKIQKRLGGKNTKEAIFAIDNNHLDKAAFIILNYYDKAYKYGLSKRNGQSIYHLQLEDFDITKNAKKILEFFDSLNS